MIEHMFAVCPWRVDGHLVRLIRVSGWSSQGGRFWLFMDLEYVLLFGRVRGKGSGCLWSWEHSLLCYELGLPIESSSYERGPPNVWG